MSLIHEALQKAESERRAGELPPLVSVPAAQRRRESDATKWGWIALGIAVLAAAAYTNRGLILPADDHAEAPQSDVARDDAVPQAVNRSPSPTTPAATSQVARKPDVVRQQPAPTPAMDVKIAAQTDAIAAALGAGRGTAPELPGGSVPENVLPEAKPKEPQRPLPNPVLPPPAATGDSADTATVAADPIEAVASPQKIDSVPTTTKPKPTSALTPSSDPGTPVPMMFELPLAIRQGLPALKVTMQVYHKDPAQRFAIIDGKRVNENGVVGNELNLIEIQRDAMMLEFRGTRFLMPRLGR